MKKLVAVAAAVLVLAGCSAAPGGEDSDSARQAPSSSETNTAAPLVAEEVALLPSEEAFLEEVVLIPEVADASPETLLASARDTCEQLGAGTSPLDVLPVQGGTAEVNEQFVNVTTIHLCDEFSAATQSAFQERHNTEG